MLSRDQVLHVARLARLELREPEVERFSGELSKVLDYIELINQLDLDDVPPTSHVIDVENALRADEPRPSLPLEREGELLARSRLAYEAVGLSPRGFRPPGGGLTPDGGGRSPAGAEFTMRSWRRSNAPVCQSGVGSASLPERTMELYRSLTPAN